MEAECRKIDALEEKYDSFNLQRKIKQLSGIYGKRTPTYTRKEDGGIAMDIEEKLQT